MLAADAELLQTCLNIVVVVTCAVAAWCLVPARTLCLPVEFCGWQQIRNIGQFWHLPKELQYAQYSGDCNAGMICVM